MTDPELRDAAVAELKLTTAGWRKPNGNPNYPGGSAPLSTHWGKAMSLLDQIGAVAPPSPGTFLFDGSAATGVVPPWSLIHQKAANRFEVCGAENGVTPVDRGKMYRVKTLPGDYASWTTGREITMAQKDGLMSGTSVGQKAWTGWSLFIPTDCAHFSGPPGSDNYGNNFIEWHGNGSGGMQQAPFHFFINGLTSQWAIDLHNRNADYYAGRAFQKDVGPLVKGRWVQAELYTDWQLSGGYLEFWLDGAKVFEWTGRTWSDDSRVYPMAGTYRNPLPVETRFYLGHFKIGTTRDIVRVTP